MKTKAQERAKFAYEKVKEALEILGKGSAKEFSSFVSGLPAMILQNGLGHTLCFLLAKAANQKESKYKKTGKEAKYWLAFEALAEWLKKQDLLNYDPDNPAQTIHELTRKRALEYLALQEEALRFLEWFKVMTKMFVEEKSA
ncbi:CRISPR-associated protein, Cmr5 family [Thermodesulfatator indicus DSM 15286]|uniref:CRISPR type III-B/RAMP module-associated protein Cmr5 n=1 Tax=Thermodesulfatator indicus (strain DSM 15286 / JCM 11887 / CIR29812) TaxID=667014 RepID=F8A972_THEID|nr:type III-B CRISPR module-associated protein Cmr5 [Thermodesulfatator indicus]AEH45208.1 CRISPR-associated protein, Cmr5 family [Thermodesulfatator indicus DSM 15286]